MTDHFEQSKKPGSEPLAERKIMDTKSLAKRIRIHSLKMTSSGGGAHIGSALSIADILAVLYGDILHVNPNDLKDINRDRFILSKGHAGVAVYAVLAEIGFFDIKDLEDHCKNGSKLCAHVSHKGIPGVEFSSGSLGHGLSVGVGMALGAKLDGLSHRTFTLLSDGECDEGSTWEAILFAAHHCLDNLIAIVDYNKIQALAPVAEVMDLEPFSDKWRSFGWGVREVDGHDHLQLREAFSSMPEEIEKPTVVIAHTIKGKGVSFMENTVLWHYRCARGAEYEAALKELEEEKA